LLRIRDGHEREPPRADLAARGPLLLEDAGHLAARILGQRVGAARARHLAEFPAEHGAIEGARAGGILGGEVEPRELAGEALARDAVGAERRGDRARAAAAQCECDREKETWPAHDADHASTSAPRARWHLRAEPAADVSCGR